METADIAADASGITMLRARRIFFMTGIIERLGNQRALERDIVSAAGTEGLINRPTNRAMVDNAIIRRRHAHAVKRGAGNISGPHANVANDDIRSAKHPEIIFAKANAFPWSGLAGNGEVRIGRTDDQP